MTAMEGGNAKELSGTIRAQCNYRDLTVSSYCHLDSMDAYMEVGRYDYKEVIGRVESGTETESNAGIPTWK